MGKNNYFQFKQFKIVQEKSAMKVNTDGVLLGAWVNISEVKNILDIGAGTGLISIMLAQRSEAKICAVEIEKNAADEAIENVNNSPWAKQISVFNMSFQHFVLQNTQQFDLVVSNPPFFSENVLNKNKNLSAAKHNQLLPFDELIYGTKKILSGDGRFAVILPATETKKFETLAKSENLYLVRETQIIPRSGKKANRYLLEFSQQQQHLFCNSLIIYNSHNGCYTSEYKKFTKDFYLNF